MEYSIQVINGENIFNYTIPSDIEIQCGMSDEWGEGNAEAIRCLLYDAQPFNFPSVLNEIKINCISFKNYTVKCLCEGIEIYSKNNITNLKYRIIKTRDIDQLREELIFYGE